MRAANERKYTDRTMEILCAGEVPRKVPPLLETIASTIDNPYSLTYNAERIATDPLIKDFRYHLVRVQIHSEINMREDVDRHTLRLWVAQTLEKLAFGDLKLDGSKPSDGQDED